MPEDIIVSLLKLQVELEKRHTKILLNFLAEEITEHLENLSIVLTQAQSGELEDDTFRTIQAANYDVRQAILLMKSELDGSA